MTTLRLAPLFLLSAVLTASAVNYSYDAAGRLSKIDYGSSGSITYSYDKAGNVLSRTVVSGGRNPAPSTAAVVNGASFVPELSPGSWITVAGTNLAVTRADLTTLPMPTTLGGVRVLVNGVAIPLLVVLGTQINGQLPYEAKLGAGSLTVEVNGVASAAFPIVVKAAAPGIFLFADSRAVAQNVGDDGALTLNTSENPIKPGKSMVVYLTGQGALDIPIATGTQAGAATLSRPVAASSVTVGGKSAIVDFLGMTPGQISLVQANIRIPDDLTVGEHQVVVTIGGQASNSAKISVLP